MSDQALYPSSHAEWLRTILEAHRISVRPTPSPAYIVLCTSSSSVAWGQLVRAVGNATQIEEGDRIEPCDESTLPHGISTTEADAEQTFSVLVGLWSEQGPIRSDDTAGSSEH